MKHIIYLIAGLIILLMIPGYVKAADVSNDYIYIGNKDYKLDDKLENVMGNDSDIDYSGNNGYQFFVRRHRALNGESTYTQFMGSVNDNGSAVCWLFNPEEKIESKFRLVAYDVQLKNANELKSNISGSVTVNYNFKWVKDNGESLSGGDNEKTISKGDDGWTPFFAGQDDRIMVFNSNIPIFDVTSETFLEDLNKYIGEKDYSGSMNGNFINDSKRTDSDDVEMPLEFKVTGGMSTGISSAYSIDEAIACNWKQTVDTNDYSYEYQCKVTVEQTKTSGKNDYNGKEFNSGWIGFGENSYHGSDYMNLTVSAESLDNLVTRIVLDTQSTDNPLRYKGYLVSKIELRVRNIDKGSSDNKCSQWVVFTTTRGGSNASSGKADSVKVEDSTGKDTTSDSSYGDDYDPVDRNNMSNIDSVKNNVSYFLDLIRNGFGFSGNHGLLSLFSVWFSWLPSGFVGIILAGFGLIVFVCVIKIIWDFLT